MRKNILVMIATFTIFSNASSQSGNFRVVEKGTENVVTSIRLTTDESVRICLQALVTTSEQNKWIDMNGAWNIRTRLDSPVSSNSSCIDIFSDKAVDDTIFLSVFEDSTVIPIPLLIRYVDSIAFVKIYLKNNSKYVNNGDTLFLKTWVYLKQELFFNDFCFDCTYVMHKADHSVDTLSELIVNGVKYKFGQNLKQCFKNQYDSIKIVLKDTTLLSNRYISFHVRSHVDSTPVFDFSGVKYRVAKKVFPENKSFLINKRGLIQVNKNITAPAEIKVLNMKGELIHHCTYIPSEGKFSQDLLPSSLKNGYYIFALTTKRENYFCASMIMR